MGMEQGGYIEEGEESDFVYGYGAGGDEYAVDYASQYGGAEPIDFAPYEPQWDLESPQFEPEPFAPYIPTWELESPSFESLPSYPDSASDVYNRLYEYYLSIGADPFQASDLAAQEAESLTGGFVIPDIVATPVPGASTPTLPDFSLPFYGLPYIPDPFLTPYTPIFPDLPTPQPPGPPLPCAGRTANGLPPPCPAGTGRGPYGSDPCVCFPLPAATTNQQQQQQKPPGPQQSSGSGGSKPPQQQQQCPTGYCKHPQTGQCIPIPAGYSRHPQTQVCTPIQQQQKCPTGYYPASNGQCLPIPKCTTPGTVFDQRVGRCVPVAQATNPQPGSEAPGTELPEEFEDVLANLKKLPWWLWAAAAGLLLYGSKNDTGSSPARRRSR